jgi:hypothetical protein
MKCVMVRNESSSLYLGKSGFAHGQEVSILGHASEKGSHLAHLSRRTELIPDSPAFSTLPFIAPYQHIGPKSRAQTGLICDSHCLFREKYVDDENLAKAGGMKRRSPLCEPENCGHSKNTGKEECEGYGLPQNHVPFPHLPIEASHSQDHSFSAF